MQNDWERTPSIQSQEEEKLECDPQLEEARQLQKQGAVILRRKSRGNPLFRKSEGKNNKWIVVKLPHLMFLKYFHHNYLGGSSMGDSTDSGGAPISIESPLPASGAHSDLAGPPQEDASYSQSSAGMRASKSDTSLTDSFVVIPPVSSAGQIDESSSKRKTNTVQNHLKEGI